MCRLLLLLLLLLCVWWRLPHPCFVPRQDRNDLLWLAIVGVTDHLLGENIDAPTYQLLLRDLSDQVSDKNVDALHNGDGTVAPAGQDGHITLVEEYRFMLYRHWSLYESMYHSQYVATRLGTWRHKTGRNQLKELLPNLGVPLKDCQERYAHMSAKTRKQFRDKLEEVGSELGLDNVYFGSFQRQLGPSCRPFCSCLCLCCVDIVFVGGGGGGGGVLGTRFSHTDFSIGRGAQRHGVVGGTTHGHRGTDGRAAYFWGWQQWRACRCRCRCWCRRRRRCWRQRR